MTDKLYCSKHKHNMEKTNDVCPECENEQNELQAESDYLNEQMAIEENARDSDYEYYEEQGRGYK